MPTVRNIFHRLLKCAFVTTTSLLVLYGLYKTMTVNSESGTTRTAKQAKTTATVAESGDHHDFEVLQDVFRKATGYISRPDGTLVNCVFIGGTHILVPRHFFIDFSTTQFIPSGTILTVSKSNWNRVETRFSFDINRFRQIKGDSPAGPTPDGFRTDVIVYQLPEKIFTAEKDIIKFFWDGTSDLTNSKVCKLDYQPFNKMGIYFSESIGTVSAMHRYTNRIEDKQQVFHILAEADYASRATSCGSLVRRAGQEAPLLGIHVASGNGQKSYFHFVTKKGLKDAMSLSGTQPEVVLDPEVVMTHSEADVFHNPSFSTLRLEYRLPKPVFQPIKTDLVPSLAYEALGPHTTEPAPLSFKDKRLPYEFSGKYHFYCEIFSKFQKRKGEFKEEEIQWAVETMRDDIKRIQQHSIIKTVKLDLHEALNGLPIPENTSMDMSTSMGWPYTPATKRDHFDVVDVRGKQVIIPKEKITKDFAKNCELLENGKIPFLPFVYTLKDERVKLRKVTTPGTRLFACGSVIHFLICRRYFYTFLMQLYHAPLADSWSYPSLDRLSLDWHSLVRHLAEVGDRGFDFDFGGWDRRTSHLLIYEAIDLMLIGMPMENIERLALIEMIASPYVIHEDNVFRVNGSVMSGILTTFAMNCVINELIHRSAFHYLATKHAPAFAEYRAYRTYVRGMRGGDDTITVVSDRVSNWYNGETVAQYLRDRGLEVTSPDKSEQIQPLTPLLQLSFLKNKSRVMNGYYIPLPDFASLVESCYWMRLNKYNWDAVKATQDNCEAALRGIYFHGRTQYTRVRDALLAKAPKLVLPTYNELHNIWTHFFYFPGLHADYASRTLQDNNYRDDVQPKSDSQIDVDHLVRVVNDNMQFYETEAESGKISTMVFENSSRKGLDKQAAAEVTDHDMAAPPPALSQPLDEKVVNEDLGSVEKTETKKVGATVQDSAQTSVKTVLTGTTVVRSHNLRAEAYLNDVRWDLRKLLEKFTFIQSVDWTITQTSGTTLAVLSLPGDILKTAAQKAPFDLTRFSRFNSITMKVVVKSSPFYSGTLVQGFTPLSLDVDYRRQINMGASVTKLSQDEGVEFKIPFRFPKGALVLPGDSIGKYALTIQAPLRTGATNANSIGVSIFASIDGMEFKVPDVIPTTNYISHKLQPNTFAITTPESGIAKEQRSVVCNINDPVREMDTTKLCAGEGTIGKTRVGHFQDSLTDLLTAMKRWRTVCRGYYQVGNGTVRTLEFDPTTLERIALGPLSYLFAANRGSIMFRARMLSSTGGYADSKGFGTISFALNETSADFASAFHTGRFDGVHYFDADSPGLVCLPYFKNTFITEVYQALSSKSLLVQLFSHASEDAHYMIEFDVCLGDDYHVGMFAGAADVLIDNTYRTTPSSAAGPIPYDQVITVAEAGVLDFVDRAIETALPIAQCASELGVLSDAHPITYQPYPIQQRRHPYGIACDLVNYKETMLTTNHNGMSLPDKDCFGVGTHEANINNLMTNTKSQTDILTWNASQTTGTVLFETDVGPLPVSGAGRIHDMLPQFFYYWNGGVKYIFDISATQQHRGQLVFAYNLAGNSAAYADATQTYFSTFDLSQGRGTITIDCPYLSNLPYMRVKTVREPSPSEPSSPGKLTVYVQNPLRSTSTVADTVDIIVYKAYAEDFHLEVFGNLGSIPTPPTSTTKYASKATRPKALK